MVQFSSPSAYFIPLVTQGRAGGVGEDAKWREGAYQGQRGYLFLFLFNINIEI